MKRKISLFLMLALIISLFAGVFSTAYAADGDTLQYGDYQYKVYNGKVTITGYSQSASGEVAVPDEIEGNPVTRIGKDAFFNLKNVTSVIVPEGVTAIEQQAFYNCFNLQKVTFPSTLTSIGVNAFYHCSSLASLQLPEGIKTIPSSAFESCSALTSIQLPESIEVIGQGAFSGCGFTKVTLPAKTTNVDGQAFSRCKSLESITVDNGNTAYCSIDGVLYSKDKKTIVLVPYLKAEGLRISDSVTTIGKHAFLNTPIKNLVLNKVQRIEEGAFMSCSSLETVVTGAALKGIGNYSFYSCPKLASIKLVEGLESIGEAAFFQCTNLDTITLPEGLKTISANAFDGCKKLAEIIFPESLEQLEGHFILNGCTGLENIYFKGDFPQISSDDVFKDVIATAYYPADNETWSDDNLQDYGGTITWKTWNPDNLESGKWGVLSYSISDGEVTITRCDENATGVIDVPSEIYGYPVVHIGTNGFIALEKVTSITLPKDCTDIAVGAFSNCTNLESIVIDQDNPEYCSVDGIVYTKDKKKLIVAPYKSTGKSFKIPNGVETLGAWSLYYNEELEELSLNDVTTVEYAAVAFCGNLATITDTEKLEKIEKSAFACTGINQIDLPEGLTFIGEAAFEYTSNLKEISLPNSLTYLGPRAFQGCTGLKSIYFEGECPQITGDTGFENVVAIAYYPKRNETWTEDKLQNYGGTLTWKTWDPSGGAIGVDHYSYNFSNSNASFGYPQDYTIPLSSYQLIYGKNVRAEDMYLNKTYKDIGHNIKRYWSGSCAGMSATSEMLVDSTNGVNPVNFNASAADPKDLSVKDKNTDLDIDLTAFIEAMHVAQYTQLFKNDRSATKVVTSDIQAGRNNLNEFHDKIKEETDAGRPVLLALISESNLGHAILGYGVEDKDDGTSEILIYDNNYPLESRTLTLGKDKSGDYVTWSYEIGGTHGVWGTDQPTSHISFVYYDTIMDIWKTRGNLEESGKTNMLSINSDDFALYSSTGKELARVENGELIKTSTDIDLMDRELSLRQDDDPDNIIVAPIAVYRVVNNDDSIEELAVSASNAELGATINTTANEVVVAVQDSVNYNSVTVCADPEDTYTVSLKSTLDNDYNEIIASGVGTEEDSTISMVGGVLDVEDCALSALVIDGEDQGPFTIKATAEEGGTITPDGESRIAKNEGVTYTITPNAGYAISDVLVDGKSVGAVATYEFKDVKGTHSIVAKFVRTNLYGDTNGDDKVDASDLTRLAKHLAKIETITNSEQLKNADVNHDGKVSSEDLTKLARFIAKIISSLD